MNLPGVLSLGSLFTGTGALDMAAEAVLGPLRLAWVSDTKPAAQRFLAHRFPGVPNLGDMTRVWPAVGPLTAEAAGVEPVDVLTAGWPCQPHSAAGKRLGEKDPRALWPNVLRAIHAVRPAVFLGENVARIVTNGELRRVVRSLAEIGYVGAWGCVRASDIGAPHRRDRCFVVAVDPTAPHAPSLGRTDLAPGCDCAALPVRAVAGASAGDRAGAAPARVRELGRATGELAALTLLPTPTQNMTTGAGTSGRDGGLNLQTAVALLPTPRASDGRHGGPGMTTSSGSPTLPALAVQHANRWGVYADAIARWEHIFGRGVPAPTQHSVAWLDMIARRRAGRDGRPVGMRGSLRPRPQLAPRFVEWMMGLPDGWVTGVPDLAPRANGHRNAALGMLGDGVVPQQAVYAYRMLLGALGERLLGSAA